MAELRGYTCDGGCGASTVLEPQKNPLASVTNEGWFQIFTPSGFPTLYACSVACAVAALEGAARRALPGSRR